MAGGRSCVWSPHRLGPKAPASRKISGCSRKPPACPSPWAALPPRDCPCPGLGPGSPGLGVSTAANVAPPGEWLPPSGPQAPHLGRLKEGVSVTTVPLVLPVTFGGDKGTLLIRGDLEALSKPGEARDRGSCTCPERGLRTWSLVGFLLRTNARKGKNGSQGRGRATRACFPSG